MECAICPHSKANQVACVRPTMLVGPGPGYGRWAGRVTCEVDSREGTPRPKVNLNYFNGGYVIGFG